MDNTNEQENIAHHLLDTITRISLNQHTIPIPPDCEALVKHPPDTGLIVFGRCYADSERFIMRLASVLWAGGRATLKAKTTAKPRVRIPKPKVETRSDLPLAAASPTAGSSLEFGELTTEDHEDDESADFSGRVHSESYSAQNLSAAFDSILKTQTTSPSEPTASDHIPNLATQGVQHNFLAAIQQSTLSTIEAYRTSILNSLALDDPHGRIYSKNVRQMKEILAYEKWRKKLDGFTDEKKKGKAERHPVSRLLLPAGSLAVRKALYDRPTIAEREVVARLIKDLWKLDQLVDATVVVAYSGKPLQLSLIVGFGRLSGSIQIHGNPGREIWTCHNSC